MDLANIRFAENVKSNVMGALRNYRGILLQTTMTLSVMYWRTQRLTQAFIEFDRELINQELDTLIKGNLLSDERFVEAFIFSRKKNGKGPLKISSELQERGADESLINRYIEEIETSEWLESAEQVVEKKLGNNQQLDYDNQLKMMKFLNNRGFTIEQVKTTIKKLQKSEEVE